VKPAVQSRLVTRQWEVTYIHAITNDVQTLIDAANKLGAEGWEPMGFTSAVEKGIGLSSNLLIFKRKVVAPPPPESAEEWQDDPTGRFDKRRWNGTVWTAETAMIAAQTLHIDPPSI
jgi:hypothetical protein